jgi:hypothetical protein
MSGNRELQAADIAPPLEFDADIPGMSGCVGVFSAAINAAAQRYAIPEGMKGNYVSFECSGDVQILFGDANVAVTRDQDSGLASEVLTADPATGKRVIAGVEKHWRLPKHKAVTHFSVIGDTAGTSGRWWMNMSNNIIVDD